MELNFGRIIILVNDYDEAFAFYERTLSCKKFFDITENGQRFLHIGLNSNDKSGIWFHKAETDEQKARVGNQTSGLPLFVVYTNSICEFYYQPECCAEFRQPELSAFCLSLCC